MRFVHNTIGIQKGLDPTNSKVTYYSGSSNNMGFFQSPYTNSTDWLWPGDGVLLSDQKTLINFHMHIGPTTGGFGF